MPKLTQIHLAEIKKWVDLLRNYLKTEEGKKDFGDREERCKKYGEALSANKISELTEADLAKLLGELWANQMWADKTQPLKRILVNITIDQFKDELAKLLWGDKKLAVRFDEFRDNVKGMGPAMITELLTLVRPKECAIWNTRAREALKILKMSDVTPVNSYGIDGEKYEEVITVLKQVAEVLRSEDLPLRLEDLLDVDYFFYFVSKSQSGEVPHEEKEDYQFDHDEVRDAIYDLGIGLGFDAETEVQIARGAKVDVLWKSKVGNLGVIKYVFEVHKSGSIDSLILNLQKAKSDQAVQRLIAVSNTKSLRTIKDEMDGLSEEFKKSIALMEARDALQASEQMMQIKEILDKLELVKAG